MNEEPLEVLGEKWSCRCGFIGDTAEEVWEHQEAEMRECEESDCSGRMDECNHCPEIASGDAAREPLVSIHAVRERLQRIRSQIDTTKYTASSTIYLYRQIKQLEEFTQNGREDIVECSECGMRQYRGNGGGECLDCGADVSQKGESGEK